MELWRKNMLPAVILLLAPLFLIAATSSAVYDPWSDLNADGEIDIFDVVTEAGAYLTTGDPTKASTSKLARHHPANGVVRLDSRRLV